MKIRFKDKSAFDGKGFSINPDFEGVAVTLEIPDGQDPKQTIKRYYRDKLARMQKEFEAEEAKNTPISDSALENLKAGFGQGIMSTLRGVGNMLGLKSDEETQAANDLDKPLLRTKAGLAGSIAGATALTAPVAELGAAGALAQAGRVASTAPKLSRALAALGKGGYRTAAAEGAAIGATQADPGERLMGAGAGAALGPLARGGGQVLKRSLTGIVKPTRAAQELMDEGIDVPLHMAAEDSGVSGGMKMFYDQILKAIPVVGGSIGRQSKEALEGFHNLVSSKALPSWASGALKGTQGLRDTMQRLGSFWNTAWDPIKSMKFSTAPNFVKPLVDAVAKKYTGKSRNKILGLINGSGEDLIRLRNEVDPSLKKEIDAYIRKNLDPNNRGANKKLLQHFESLDEPYDAFKVMQDAAAKGTEMLPKQIAESAAGTAPKGVVAAGQAPLQDVAEKGAEVITKQSLNKPNFWQRAAVTGSLGASSLASLPVFLGIAAGTRGLTTKAAQKALMGQYRPQRRLAKALAAQARRTATIGRVGRHAAEHSRGHYND